MWVLWPSHREFRSFYDPASHRLSLLSDVIDDHAEGRVYDERVAISVTATGELLDIEVLPGPVSRPSSMRRPHPVRRDEPVEVWIPEIGQASIEVDDGSGSVLLRFAAATPAQWIELGDSGVVLGLAEDDVLVVLEVRPQVDPDGELESQWLDTIGA